MYPPIADRIFQNLGAFDLAQDSAAAEILSDFIKAWVDPEGNWEPALAEEATARAVLDTACGRLQEYIRTQRQT
jgi:hypothetical protein